MNAKIGRVISKANYVLAYAGAIMLVVLLLYNCGNALSRYLFRAPFPAVTELSSYMLAATVFLAMGYALEQKAHISVDVVVSKLGSRTRLAVELVANVGVCLVALLLLVGGFDLALSKWNVVSSTDLQVWLFPIYLSIPVGSLLLLLQALRTVVPQLKSEKEVPRLKSEKG